MPRPMPHAAFPLAPLAPAPRLRSPRARQPVLTMASAPRTMDSHSSQRGHRQVAAAAERNAAPILAVLSERLAGAPSGTVLEVASGTGQHAAAFAAALPQLTWQPTEAAPDAFPSIAAWAEGAPNVRPPLALDAAAPPADWPLPPGTARAVLAVNMAHISPWAATRGLVAGAAHVLAPGGELFLYGPFLVDGAATTESNAAFDARLRATNPEWGYRDVAAVAAEADAVGLTLEERRPMPANNFFLVFRRREEGAER